MPPSEQQLIDAIEHISFEMHRYLYTAHPIPLPGRYNEIVAESCLLHSRNIGDFFFGKEKDDDIVIDHYYDKLIAKDELQVEIEKSKVKWGNYKKRTNKKLCHLTYSRTNSTPIDMKEKNDINFGALIRLFENMLPTNFREKWEQGKLFSI